MNQLMTVLRAYVGAVTVVGLAVSGFVLSGGVGGPGLVLSAPVIALALAAQIGELFPLSILRRDGNEEIEVSHAFLLAILLIAGPATAVAVQLVTIVITSIARRRPPIKAAFNIAQKAAAVAAAGAAYAALADAPAMTPGNGLTATELAAFVVAALTFQMVNETAVSFVCALAERRPPLTFLLSDSRQFGFSAMVSLSAPLAAAGALVGWWLVPVMIGPLWAVRRATSVSLAHYELAHRDALTELPNAIALREALDEALATRDVAVVMLDLDGFKEINDGLGHQAGDAVLKGVAARIAGLSLDRSRLFRLQGDEFVALMDEPGAADALDYAGGLMGAFHRPFEVSGLDVEIGLSAGVALATRRTCATDELLRRADVAMYRAKRHRTGFALYDADSDNADPARQVLAADLRRALAAGEVEVHYQPQISLATGRASSFEGLARWRRPDGTIVAPDEFIPQAELTGLINPLTLHVLRTALADCRRWTSEFGYAGRVGINLSPRCLHQRGLVDDVRLALDEAGLPADRLELEITESALMADPAGARRTLTALHELGIDILIDDFGTGYSSLAYLGTLPVDGIKIDGTFVAGMATEHHDAVIVRSTIDLGHNLGLRVVAECVEDEATRARLAELGADLAQGWLWSPAVPAAEIDEALFRTASLTA